MEEIIRTTSIKAQDMLPIQHEIPLPPSSLIAAVSTSVTEPAPPEKDSAARVTDPAAAVTTTTTNPMKEATDPAKKLPAKARTSSSRTKSKKPAKDAEGRRVFTRFTDNDVVVGRGNGIACLPGNINFRRIIVKYRPTYTTAYRNEKTEIARQVMSELAAMKPPARFLEQLDDRRFVEIGDRRALEKTCQALREKKMSQPSEHLYVHTVSSLHSRMVRVQKKDQQQADNKNTTGPVTGPKPSPNRVAERKIKARSKPKKKASATKKAASKKAKPTLVKAASPKLKAASPKLKAVSVSPTPSAKLPEPLPSEDLLPSSQDIVVTAGPHVLHNDITKNDVLFDKRGRLYRKPFGVLVGNGCFTHILTERSKEYAASSVIGKTLVATSMIRQWKAQKPVGRFLQQDAATNAWYELDELRAMEVTCRSLGSGDEKQVLELLKQQQESQQQTREMPPPTPKGLVSTVSNEDEDTAALMLKALSETKPPEITPAPSEEGSENEVKLHNNKTNMHHGELEVANVLTMLSSKG